MKRLALYYIVDFVEIGDYSLVADSIGECVEVDALLNGRWIYLVLVKGHAKRDRVPERRELHLLDKKLIFVEHRSLRELDTKSTADWSHRRVRHGRSLHCNQVQLAGVPTAQIITWQGNGSIGSV
jgi:hypothetical protein